MHIDENRNPWTILGEKEIYDNKWIRITEYDVLNPAGGKGIYGKVHFKNLAIGVIALDDDLNTYLVGQYRFTLNQYSWEIPEGGGPHADAPLASAQRELLEETGLTASKWTMLRRVHLSNSVTDEDGYLFLAQGLEQHQPMPEDTEELQVKKIPFEAAWQMLERGEITDALTLIAMMEVKLILQKGGLR